MFKYTWSPREFFFDPGFSYRRGRLRNIQSLVEHTVITVTISYGSLPEKAPPIKLFRPPPWRSHRRGRLTDIQSLVDLGDS